MSENYSTAYDFTSTFAPLLTTKSTQSFLNKHYINLSISTIFINALISIIATFLNSLIILTFVKTTSLRQAPSNLLVLGLAIADFGVAVFSQPAFCFLRIARVNGNILSANTADAAFTASFSLFGYVSLSTLTFITTDRFLAVHLHLRYQELVTTKRYGITLALIWVGSISLCFGRMLSKNDVLIFLDVIIPVSLGIFNVIAFFKISQVIHRHSVQIQAQQQSVQQSIDIPRYKKSVNTMYYVIGAFVLCYVPFVGALIAYHVYQDYGRTKEAIIVSETILIFNGVLNPVIYCIRVGEIRIAVRTLLQRLVQR
jgi:hypothetical protein